MTLCKNLILAGVVMAASTACAATYCHWTGAAQDGIWGTPGNWEEGHAPGLEDYVVIDCGSGLEISITEETTIGKFQPYGNGTLTLNGEKLSIRLASNGAFSNACAVVMNAPLGLAGTSFGYQQNFVAMAPATFNAPVTMIKPKGGATVTRLHIVCANLKNASIVFNDTVSTFVDETIGYRPLVIDGMGNTPIVFRKKVTADSIGSTYGTPAGGGMEFYGPLELMSHEYGINYRTSHVCAKDVLDDTIFLDWKEDHRGGRLYLDGVDQTVDYLTGVYLNGSNPPSDDLSKPGRALCSDEPATLTMRASQSAEAPVYVKGQVSLVYDAKDKDFVQTFAYRPSSTTGSITVKKGTVKIDKGASFSNIVELAILADGAFEIGSENGVPNPLANLEILDIAEGGKIKVPEGVSLSCAMIRIAGRWQAAGDYSSATSDWIEGDGSVTARPVTSGPTRWRGPNSGSSEWNAATNWTRGVPSSALPALVDEPASSPEGYEIIIKDATVLNDLTVDAPGAGPARISACDTVTLEGPDVVLGPNGVLSAGDDGVVEMKTQGALKLRGGAVSLSGTGVWNDSIAKNHSLFAGYGSVTFSGQSKLRQSVELKNPLFYLSQDADSIGKGSLSVVFRDDASFDSVNTVDAFNVSYYAHGEVSLALRDRSRLESGRRMNIGYAEASTGTVEIADSAMLSVTFYGMRIAMAKQALGTLRVSGGIIDNYVNRSGNFPTLYGINLGEGEDSSEPAIAHDRKGVIDISGGIITNRGVNAFLTVGIGTGEGEIRQSGGLIYLPGNALALRGGMTLGLRGGRGSYAISGGKFKNRMQTYVGGTELDRLYYTGDDWPTDRGGFGTFKISGGTYEAENDFYVSLAGRGEVEVSGGQLTIGGRLSLTNSVDALSGDKYAAKLVFKVKPDGACGAVTVGESVEIAEGSEIVVDMTDAPESVERIKLISTEDGINGAVLGSNVRLVGASDDYKLRLTRLGLGVSKVKGLVLLVR